MKSQGKVNVFVPYSQNELQGKLIILSPVLKTNSRESQYILSLFAGKVNIFCPCSAGNVKILYTFCREFISFLIYKLSKLCV